MNKSFIAKTLIILLMTVGSSPGMAAEAEKSFNAQQEVQRMERHWDKLMREENMEKRQQLIREHRKMMDEALEKAGIDRFHMGMMHHGMEGGMDHHKDHMTNTIEMHHMQLDMMEE